MARCKPIAIAMVDESQAADVFPFDRLPAEMKWLVLRNLDTTELLLVALVSDEWTRLIKMIVEKRQKAIILSTLVQDWPDQTGEFMTKRKFENILLSLVFLKLNICLIIDNDAETRGLLEEAGPHLFSAAVRANKSAEVKFLEVEELRETLFSTTIILDSNLELLTITDYACNLEDLVNNLVESPGVWVNVNYEETCSDPSLKRCTVICSWQKSNLAPL